MRLAVKVTRRDTRRAVDLERPLARPQEFTRACTCVAVVASARMYVSENPREKKRLCRWWNVWLYEGDEKEAQRVGGELG